MPVPKLTPQQSKLEANIDISKMFGIAYQGEVDIPLLKPFEALVKENPTRAFVFSLN